MSLPAIQDPAALSYEEARDELIAVVNRLEQGGTTLEESLQLWERGEALAARCEEWLLGARQRLEAARQGDGSPADGASVDGSSGGADTTVGGDA
ncbi:exodeoxyribonuclease VII small subunit [Leucobacter sp. CSA1]|uniref:Exodeoxyribonuclease 7 small subunit n=1 Tax=Leucobacter chromiisoli TaxID=2796471 RepID=A0A934Q5P2_9MICO|nr:exodeoxyribonuclease VII small subunit [Leucobacter chromiisoli]MBK0417850.1 exodeoxyribonuclease VII small subunit [Leucobacter chromiisoli]